MSTTYLRKSFALLTATVLLIGGLLASAPQAFAATTNPATNITDTDATLNGTGEATDATGSAFWVSENSFTATSSASPSLPPDVYSTGQLGPVLANASFSAQLSSATMPSGLLPITPNTTYYFVAWTEVGGTWNPGAVLNFTTTGSVDTTPDAFTFTDQTDVAVSTMIESNEVTIAGLSASATSAISVTGGEYSINSGTYTSSSGTIMNGDMVKVRHTSSASNSTATDTVLTIGGVSDTFTSTTAAALDTTPDAFTFTDQTNVALSTMVESNEITVAGLSASATSAITVTGGEYSINSGTYTATAGNVSNGDLVKVRHTSSASNSTATDTALTIGGVSDTFTSTTVSANPSHPTTVAASSITDTNATLNGTNGNTTATGSAFWVSETTFSVSSSSSPMLPPDVYSTGDLGPVLASANFSAQLSSATIPAGLLPITPNTTYYFVAWTNVGGTWNPGTVLNFTTTGGVDTTPDAFSFTDQTNVALGVVVESNAIVVAGINAGAAITVTGGEYSINSGTYTSAAGTINNGDNVKLRHTASASVNTATNTVLTIGGVSDTFTSTTQAVDSTPDAFSFTDQTGVALSTMIESNTITIAGINASATAAITITGGEYSINGGTYTSAAGTISNGNTVKVRHTSSGSNSTSISTVLTIGGISDTFISTTLASSGGGGGGGGGGNSGSSSSRSEIAGCGTRTSGFSTVNGRSCARNIPHGEVLGSSIGPIPGCDNRTTGFSTISGVSCATNLVNGAIPGCDNRTTGFSTVSGVSCANNFPGQVLGSGTYHFTRFLKAGPPYPLSLMVEVVELQRFLNLRMYDSGILDGKFGPRTRGAVIRFQIAMGLLADGIVGPQTRAALNR